MTVENQVSSKSRAVRGLMLSAVLASAVFVLFVLPAEFGVDPTGVGQLTGLIKEDQGASSSSMQGPQALVGNNKFHRSFDIAPSVLIVDFEFEALAEAEYKLQVKEGRRLQYMWSTDGGLMYSDMHGHTVPKNKDEKEVVVKYLETQEGVFESGEFETPLVGDHGWYFLNLEERKLKLRLTVFGDYQSHELLVPEGAKVRAKVVRDSRKNLGVKAVMMNAIVPASNALWASGEPKTDDDWGALELAVMKMRRATPLVELGWGAYSDASGKPSPEWGEFTQEMQGALNSALNAISQKSYESLLDAGDSLYTSCESCHTVFNPGVKGN